MTRWRRLRPALGLLLSAAACGGGQSTDDALDGTLLPTAHMDLDGQPNSPTPTGHVDMNGRPNPLSMKGSPACIPERVPIAAPDGVLVEGLQRLEGSYAIDGVWAELPEAPFEPSGVPATGAIELSYLGGELTRHQTCTPGVEVPVEIQLLTDDGALAETVPGTAFLADRSVAAGPPGTRAAFTAELSAALDLGNLRGSLRGDGPAAEDYVGLQLSAFLAPFGSRGQVTLVTAPAPMPTPSIGAPATATAPAANVAPRSPLFSWPAPAACDLGEALSLAETAESAELAAAIATANADSFAAQYEDGSTTEVSVQIDQPQSACGGHSYVLLHTQASLVTADDKIDVRLPVSLIPFIGPLHFNSRTDVAWALPPERFAELHGTLALETETFAHIGVMAALHDDGEMTRGELTVWGYDMEQCGVCDDLDGCIECPTDDRATVLLKLSFQ